MKLIFRIALISIAIFACTKFLPIDEIYWGYTHQDEAKTAISKFYRLYNYGSYQRMYDNVMDAHTRLTIPQGKFAHILNKFKIEKGRFIAPVSKAQFHYKPFIEVKNFVTDFFQYRDENIEQNTFYVFKKRGRKFYCINFHAKYQRGFAPANFILVDTIDGLKVITPMKPKYIKKYI